MLISHFAVIISEINMIHITDTLPRFSYKLFEKSSYFQFCSFLYGQSRNFSYENGIIFIISERKWDFI